MVPFGSATRWRRWAVAFLLSMTATTGSALAAGEIERVRAPKLALYESPDGAKVGEVPRDDVSVPLDVQEVAANRRLQVLIDGKPYWIAPHQVIMADGVQVESGCIRVSEAYASTRGLGSCP